MITCNVVGYTNVNSGLGNQLFVIAATLGLAKRNNAIATFPDLLTENYKFYGETIFHKLNKFGNQKDFSKFYIEPPYTSTKYNEIKYQENLCLKGHFLSYKYFHNEEEYIKSMFQLPSHIVENINKQFDDIDFNNSVMLHIRRGDYVNLSNYHTNLNYNYYNSAINFFNNDKIYIFSDDIEWCKNNISFKNKELFFLKKEKDIVHLYLMSKFKNFIIANSTFSWWGAYLSDKKDKKIIAPKNWFGPDRTKNNELETKDLCPSTWERI